MVQKLTLKVVTNFLSVWLKNNIHRMNKDDSLDIHIGHLENQNFDLYDIVNILKSIKLPSNDLDIILGIEVETIYPLKIDSLKNINLNDLIDNSYPPNFYVIDNKQLIMNNLECKYEFNIVNKLLNIEDKNITCSLLKTKCYEDGESYDFIVELHTKAIVW